MSATTPRTISNAPDLRQLLAAVGALILAVALLVAVTMSRQASFDGAASVAEPASVTFDHGWSTAAGAQDLVVSTANGGIRYTGIPYPARPTWNDQLIVSTPNGGINYTGIPYPAQRASSGGLVVATQNGGILYTGIPYPAPETRSHSGSNGTQFAR